MRNLRAGALTCALSLILPSLALAAPGASSGVRALDPASAESFAKRLFLLRRSVDRGDCDQAIQAADLIMQDFGDVKEARLGRAWALSCEQTWLDAWELLETSNDMSADAKELRTLIAQHLAIVEIAVTLDGKPLTGKEAVDLTPIVVAADGKASLRRPATKVGPSLYQFATNKSAELQIVEAVGQPDLRAERVSLTSTLGKSVRTTLAWKTVPIGSLEVAITQDGKPASSGLPAPIATTEAGAQVTLTPVRPGVWGAARIEAGVIDVRLPETEQSEEATLRVTVAPKVVTSATLDAKQVPTSEIIAPELTSGLQIFLRTGETVLPLSTDPVRRRAGAQDLLATWSTALGTDEVAEWRETTAAGAHTVRAPWAWQVRDVDGAVLVAGLETPASKRVELTGMRVPLKGKGSLELVLEGALEASPGRIVTGRVDRASHPAATAQGAARKLGTTRAVIGGIGGAAVVGAGAWMLAEIGNTARASALAQSVDPATGLEEYNRMSALADAAALRGNIALGTTITAALGTGVGLGLTFAFGGGEKGDPTKVPLMVEVGR